MGYVTIPHKVKFSEFLEEIGYDDCRELAEMLVSKWDREEMLNIVFDDSSALGEVDIVDYLYHLLTPEKQVEFYNRVSGSDAMMSTVSASMKAAKLALEQLQDEGCKVVENINLALEKMET